MRSTFFAVSLALAAAACPSADAGNDPPLLTDRVWVDRVAPTPKDSVGRLVFVRAGPDRYGIDGRGTPWRDTRDMFLWRFEDGRVQMGYPEQGKRRPIKIEIADPCTEKKGFDLCLTLRSADSVRRFYSRRADRLSSADRAEITHAFQAAPRVAFDDLAFVYNDGAGIPGMAEP